jgi:tetratricopeptide (TPR) repeat protein
MKKVSALLTLSALLFSILPVLTVSAQPAPVGRIAQNTNSAKFYFDRAQEKAFAINFDYKGAIADYDTAISIDPKYVDAYTYRGLAKFGSQDNQGAIADLNTAISIDPKSADAYFFRAAIKHDNLQDKQGGINDMIKASELYREQGDMNTYKEAIKKIEQWK